MLSNDESIQHPEDFWSTLPLFDGMGIVSDKSSYDQTIHPDHAKVAGKTCHITLKYHLNWMTRVKEELEEITVSGFIKMDFSST